MPNLRSRKTGLKGSDKSLQNESPLDPSTPSKSDAISVGGSGGSFAPRRRSLRLSGISASTVVAPNSTRKRKGMVFDDDLSESANAKMDSLVAKHDEVVSERERDRPMFSANKKTRTINLSSRTRISKRLVKMENKTSIEENVDIVNQAMIVHSETDDQGFEIKKEMTDFELSNFKGKGVELEGEKHANKEKVNQNNEIEDDKIRKGKMVVDNSEEIKTSYDIQENGLENQGNNVDFEMFNEISTTENGENTDGMLVIEPVNLVTDKDEVLCEGSNNRRGRNRPRMSQKSRKEKERKIAQQLAPKYALFKNDEVDSEEEEHEELLVDDNQVEDWPGPFSTAMKIIRDREQNLIARELNSSKKVDEDEVKINWSPSKGVKLKSFAKVPPTLYDLCVKVLCENAEEIESLDGVPDVMKHRLASHLCRVRKMGSRVLGLFASGSPVEIHIGDCSWATEGEFEMAFGGSNLEKLKVMELNLSGRCLSDYVLKDVFAKSPGSLPLLTKLSLKGNYRLSDDGLNAIATSAPLLSSINLSQCSFITSAGIINLVDKLESVLRELCIDECPDLNAMLILPSLIKLKHLEVLSVAGIETVTDKFVKKLVSVCGSTIKELVFSSCRKMTNSSIKVVGENCPNLCSLDLRNLNRLNDSAIGHIANGCRSIQKLKLRRNAFSDEAVAAFVEASGGSLSVLSLNNIQKVAQQTAIAIGRRCSNLRSLDLSFCRNISNEGLGLIVDSCSTLKLVKLFGCTQINQVFLEGHSNPNVKIVGSKGGSLLDQIQEQHFL